MNLHPIPCDPIQPLDSLTKSEIIGRDASPVTKLKPPHFPVDPSPVVKFGVLGEWLEAHRKRRKIKK